MSTHTHFNSVHKYGELEWTKLQHRPKWMSDSQWQQACAYLNGQAIPSDMDMLNAIKNPAFRLNRPRQYWSGWDLWLYSHVPEVIIGDKADEWMGLINRYSPAFIDIGL